MNARDPMLAVIAKTLGVDTLERTILEQLAETMPRMEDAPAPIVEANRRARLLIGGALDLLAAANAVLHCEHEDSQRGEVCDACMEALAKAVDVAEGRE